MLLVEPWKGRMAHIPLKLLGGKKGAVDLLQLLVSCSILKFPELVQPLPTGWCIAGPALPTHGGKQLPLTQPALMLCA